MRVPIGVRKLAAVIAAAFAVFALFFSVVRPLYLRWGATDAELATVYPGEEIFPLAGSRSVRAVTVGAPADEVWPWLAQIGQDRGGFYSYEVLEDIVGCKMPRATRVMQDHQAWREGDQLWMYPKEKLDGAGGARLVAHEPGRFLMFASRALGAAVDQPEAGVWGFVVRPLEEGRARVLAVSRSAPDASPVAVGFARAVFEPAHYVMERRMLVNLRTLAEGGTTSWWNELMEVTLWTLTVLILVAALVAVARRRQWATALTVAVMAALVFQVLTLLQPPLVIGTPLVIWLVMSLWWGSGGFPVGAGAIWPNMRGMADPIARSGR